MNSTFNNWSNRELHIINKYRQRVYDLQLANLENKIVQKDTNSLDFYRITPKQELPKYLQKMKFQTLHSKQKDVSKTIKIFKKQNSSPDEVKIRTKLKNNGKILLLSEIYKNLGQNGDFIKKTNQLKQQNFGVDLQQWQKNKNAIFMDKIMILKKKNANGSPRHRQSRIIQQKLSQMQRKNQKGNVNYFKESSNYKRQIQKQLQIICVTHSNQLNQINKYILIQNSSKLLKKELDQRKIQIQQDIIAKMKILNQTRIQHHNLFQEKTRLILQDRQFYQQVNPKDQFGISLGQNTSYFMTKSDKINDLKLQKRTQIEQNQSKIMRTKKMIDSLQNYIVNAEQELRSIMVGQRSYFKSSLKIGMDCRDTGLGWIIKKLGIKQNQLEQYEFPLYLDKKSKEFLIAKTNNQDQLDKLLQQKRKFVNQIGRDKHQNQISNFSKTNQLSASSNVGDKIIQSIQADSSDIPKKYRRSLRKITILNQQFAQNQSLIQLRERNSKGFQISSNTDGLTGKKLYESVTQKIKMFDFSKMKKDKNGVKNKKILQYQNLLNNIKQVHIYLEDLDIQHQLHLVNHYKDNREIFYVQAAACFGYKKAYSMIIKHFSWKNEMQI